MPDPQTTDDFDIDKLLDQAGEEDELTTELERLKTEAAELATKNAALEEQLKNDKEEPDPEKDEKEELSPEIKELNRKLEELETGVALDRAARVTSGMAELKENYPDLMTNKDILDAPLIDGTPTTAKEFLESMLAGGDTAALDKAVQKIALLNGIKLEKVSEALPRGRTPSGEDEPDKELKTKIKNVNDMIAKMRTGEFARQRAKEKGLI